MTTTLEVDEAHEAELAEYAALLLLVNAFDNWCTHPRSRRARSEMFQARDALARVRARARGFNR